MSSVSFIFSAGALTLNEDPYCGGVRPRSDPEGNWIPPIHIAGLKDQIKEQCSDGSMVGYKDLIQVVERNLHPWCKTIPDVFQSPGRLKAIT